MDKAKYYAKKESNEVVCLLCPRQCRIKDGGVGFCRVRENAGGELYATNYGAVAAGSLDPIEKKPLYHFYPGTSIMSYGTTGCNLRCPFCQNWGTVHENPKLALITPERAVAIAVREREEGSGNIGIAYTYSEPLVWYEFVLDTAKQAREAGLKNVLITNGYINEAPLRELLPYIDAMNIDVKGFTDSFYSDYCRGSLAPVLRTVELVVAEKCHVELTNLLITGLNDGAAEIGQLVDWVAGLNGEIPLHFSRYFPAFEMELPPTPLATLQTAADIAKEKLAYVYVGNAPELSYQNTACPNCGQLLIGREGYRIDLAGLQEDGCCGKCGQTVINY